MSDTAILPRSQRLKQHFKDRYSQLQDIRRPMEALWKLVDEVVLPYVFTPPSKDKSSTDFSISVNKKIYDGTTMNASQVATNAFIGATMPQSANWVLIVAEDESQSRNRNFAKWSKLAEKIVYGKLRRSNFYFSRNNFVKQGLDYGTSASIRKVDSIREEYVFETLPRMTYYIDDDENGECNTLWREIWMYNKYVVKNFDLSELEEGKRAEIRNNPNKRTLVIHAVEPRDDFDPTSRLSVKRKFASYYFIAGDFTILEESGYKRFPYKVWRPVREPGMVYGLGPGIFAIRDSHVLQAAAKTMIDAANRSVDPPWAVPKSIEGEEELFPGGRTYVNPEDIQGLAPLVSGMNYPLGKDWVQELKEACKRHYMVDSLLVLSQMDSGDRTATEVDELKAEKSQMISAILSSFCSEYLDMELEDLILDMLDAGTIPMLQTPGKNQSAYKFDYVGPLPAQQRTVHRTAGIRRLFAEVAPYAKVSQTILDWLDEGEFVEAIGEGYNALNGVRERKDVEKIQQTRAQMQQAQMQQQMALQQAQVAAEIASKGGKAPEPGSMAQRVGQ